MPSTEDRPFEIGKAMSLIEKTLALCLLLAAVGLVVYGLYLVGLLMAVGAIFFVITKMLRAVGREAEPEKSKRKSDEPSTGRPVSESVIRASSIPPVSLSEAQNTEKFVRNTIKKRKANLQHNLFDGIFGGGSPPPADEKDEEQARKDHEDLVEYFRKKEESMRTAVPVEFGDAKAREKLIKKHEAYIEELMEPTITPWEELAEKQKKK